MGISNLWGAKVLYIRNTKHVLGQLNLNVFERMIIVGAPYTSIYVFVCSHYIGDTAVSFVMVKSKWQTSLLITLKLSLVLTSHYLYRLY